MIKKWIRCDNYWVKDYGGDFKGVIVKIGSGYVSELFFSSKSVMFPKLSSSLKSAKNMVDRRFRLDTERGKKSESK